MPLTTQQKKYLKGLCHHLQPVVTVAAKGLTENVIGEIEQGLDHHELIKIRLRQERQDRSQTAAQIVQSMSAEMVMSIGQIVCLYRPNPKKEASQKITLPKS